jgi:RNA polymerase-binding protein DksA
VAKKSAPTRKSAPKGAAKPAGKATAKPVAKAAVKPVAKPTAKPSSSPAAKGSSKPSPKAASKPAAPAKAATAKAAPTKVATAAKPAPAPKAAAAAKSSVAKPSPAVKAGPVPKPGDRAGERAGDKSPKGAAPAAAASPADVKKPARKGITIVSPKPMKKPGGKPAPGSMLPSSLGKLLNPKSPLGRKPLIPSGPKAAHQRPLGQHGGVYAEEPPPPQGKTPFTRKELERFREILVRKRAELVGDVSTMEAEALRSGSGSLSNTPQHLAEQGSETYEQALSLDLAAADRKLIREIDDALRRIEDGTFGVCEMTGKPIKLERLEELPWARYSIEAARELERQAMRAS